MIDDPLYAARLYRDVSHLRYLGVICIQRRPRDKEARTISLAAADGSVMLRGSVYLMHEVIRAPEERASAVRRVIIRQIQRVNTVREQRKRVVQPRFKGIPAVKTVQTLRQRGMYLLVHAGIPRAQRYHLVRILAAMVWAKYLCHRVIADIKQPCQR